MKIYTNNIIIDIVNKIVNNEGKNKDFTWHYLFIVSYIRTAPYYDRTFYSKGFVNLNINHLRKLVSYDYAKKFLDDLIMYGIIETDNFYIKSSKSKGYKLSDKYKTEKFRLVEIEDIELNKKLTDVLNKPRFDLLKSTDGYGYITRCMDNLILDRKKAQRFVRDKIDKSEDKRIEFCKMVIELFDTKFATKDDTGDRLHNNLTNAPTEFRKFLSFDNKPLFQADIRNSQPFFLYCFLKSNCSIKETELNKYRDVVCKYGFYEFFAEKMGIKLTEKSRSKFKKRIFGGVLFDKNRKDLSDYEKVFEQEFPEIFYVVRRIKTERYKDVAIMLQKTESRFIFSCVETLMYLTKKQIPLFTVHDSISTTEEYIDLVENVMLEKFEKEFSIIPKIKTEKFA